MTADCGHFLPRQITFNLRVVKISSDDCMDPSAPLPPYSFELPTQMAAGKPITPTSATSWFWGATSLPLTPTWPGARMGGATFPRGWKSGTECCGFCLCTSLITDPTPARRGTDELCAQWWKKVLGHLVHLQFLRVMSYNVTLLGNSITK